MPFQWPLRSIFHRADAVLHRMLSPLFFVVVGPCVLIELTAAIWAGVFCVFTHWSNFAYKRFHQYHSGGLRSVAFNLFDCAICQLVKRWREGERKLLEWCCYKWFIVLMHMDTQQRTHSHVCTNTIHTHRQCYLNIHTYSTYMHEPRESENPTTIAVWTHANSYETLIDYYRANYNNKEITYIWITDLCTLFFLCSIPLIWVWCTK